MINTSFMNAPSLRIAAPVLAGTFVQPAGWVHDGSTADNRRAPPNLAYLLHTPRYASPNPAEHRQFDR